MSFRCCSICSAYFPLGFSLLLTFSLFPLFNLLPSPLDPLTAFSLPIAFCLAQFPLAAHFRTTKMFSWWTPIILPRVLPSRSIPLVFFFFVFLLSYSFFFMMFEMICPCVTALCSGRPHFFFSLRHLISSLFRSSSSRSHLGSKWMTLEKLVLFFHHSLLTAQTEECMEDKSGRREVSYFWLTGCQFSRE